MSEPLYAFDAFISYRHQEPDKAFARDLLKSLQGMGYHIAFDEITFSPQASFLEEMERCVRTSRFMLAVLSPRYFESGNTQEEAIITKVMDMGDRQRRLIPLVMEEVERPIWLYNLVGINFTDPDPLMPPLEKLKIALGKPLVQPENPTSEAAIIPEKSIAQPAPGNLQQRLKLTQRLSEIPGPQFEQMLFAVNVPKGIVAGASAPQGQRVASLLEWAEGLGGCGLTHLQALIDDIINPR